MPIFAIFLLLATYAEAFTLGLISEKPAEKLKNYAPMAAYLEFRLKEAGIKGVTVVVAKDTEEMSKLIKAKGVDLLFESAYSTVLLKESVGMVPSLLVWKKGVREYKTVFFVRKDSPVKGIEDLNAKSIVFEDPRSTSAYLLPRAELLSRGVRFKGGFAGGELNQAFYVTQGRAEAGAFNDGDWETLPEKIKRELRIVYESRPVIRYVGSFHPAVPVKIREKVEDILMGMDNGPEGIETLEKVVEIKKMERLTKEDIASLEYVKDLMGYVK